MEEKIHIKAVVNVCRGGGSFGSFSAWGGQMTYLGKGLRRRMGVGGNYGIDITFSHLFFLVTNSSLLYSLVHDLLMCFHQK